ncbi:MAG: response regulator, partial [Chloroflexota bacterium]
MPVMDGIEATKLLRQTPGIQNVNIIAISASAFGEDRQRCLDAGCNIFMTKPVHRKILLEQIESLLSLKWIYETPKIQRIELPSALTDNLPVSPPYSEIQMLYGFVRKGDIKGINNHIASLETLESSYQPFANKLREMAKRYQIKQMREFLKLYLKETEDEPDTRRQRFDPDR